MNFVRPPMNVLRFALLVALKLATRALYRFRVEWLSGNPAEMCRGVTVGVLLNHTSLIEPIFCGVLPLRFLWQIASRGAFPGADITLNRPVLGPLIKLLAPKVITITRKRDESWEAFLQSVDENTLVLITPEGRMKRRNGLDKTGEPMTVRGGIVEILRQRPHGKMLLCYSHGLHHIQAPGEGLPRPFKTVEARFEAIEIESFLNSVPATPGDPDFSRQVCRKLEALRDENCVRPLARNN